MLGNNNNNNANDDDDDDNNTNNNNCVFKSTQTIIEPANEYYTHDHTTHTYATYLLINNK